MAIAQFDRKELLEKLDKQAEPVTGWQPEAGDTIIGLVTDRRRDNTSLGNEVDVLVIEAEDDNTYAVWCTAKVLVRLIEKNDPHVGDVVAVRYVGLRNSQASGRQYKYYCMTVQRQSVKAASGSGGDTRTKGKAEALEITDADVPF